MVDRVDYARLTEMLRKAADKIKANRDYLSRLDAATGDGDHGIAVCKVADAIIATIGKDESRNIATVLKDIGWAVMSTDAGSTSPLYGSFFMGMSSSKAAGNEALDASGFAAMLDEGMAGLRKNTKAEVGGKTMIDALVPAMAAIHTSIDSGRSLAQALTDGAGAAVNGAEATRDMKALFGRAKNIGERSIGHIDPGAISMSLLFVGIKEGYEHG
ncbi:MAG: dihydroxyacetone kinase subunit DhaL [bacterium]